MPGAYPTGLGNMCQNCVWARRGCQQRQQIVQALDRQQPTTSRLRRRAKERIRRAHKRYQSKMAKQFKERIEAARLVDSMMSKCT